MGNWIANLFKQAETHKRKIHIVQPFMLIGQDGTPFTAFSLSKGRFFSSSFFTIASINEKSHCAVLEVLHPCCCGGKLIRTEARVFIDLTCFYGIQMMTIPVFDGLQMSCITAERICLPFMLTKEDDPKMIYKLNQLENQHTETISVHYAGIDPHVELNLYTNENKLRLMVPRNGFRSVTVFNLLSIEIASPIDVVQGMIEIQLNLCEKKTIYY